MNPVNAGKALFRMAGSIDNVAPVAKVGDTAKKAVSRMADDWGWKGNKSSDISTDDYFRKLKRALKTWDNTGDNYDYEALMYDEVAPKLGYDWLDDITDTSSTPETVDSIMQSFRFLQKKGMPREWTGKYTKAFTKSNFQFPDFYPSAVDDFRLFDRGQRDTFITLLPEWDGTMDELINTVRLL